MKYIRTKDGNIYEVIEEKDTKICIGWNWKENIYVDKNEILKQADTIEELCDEFVVIYANGRINQFKANTMANEVQTTNDFVKQLHLRYCKEMPNYEKVFGAIWTDKGLIYVAKMNEKGELELL